MGNKRQRKAAAQALHAAPQKRLWLDVLLVFAVGFGVFGNSLGNGFVYDDTGMIVENKRLADPWAMGTFFGTSYMGAADATDRHYRPLTVWSFAVDRALFGPGPAGVHAENVLMDALVGVLAWLLLLRLTGRRLLALAAALLFIVHPVHTEVVANGVGRSELAAALAILGAALLHLDWLEARLGRRAYGEPLARRTRGNRRLVAALAVYFVGLFYKESAAVLPALIFLADWLLVERGDFGAVLYRLWAYLLYAVPLGIYLVIRSAVVGTTLPDIQEVMAHTSSSGRVLHALETLLCYLGQLCVPWSLCGEYSDYRHLINPALSDPLVLGALAAAVLAVLASVWLYRRGKYLPLFGVLWFMVCIFPASNLFFPVGTIRADRLLFLPSLGFVLVLCWAVFALARSHQRIALAALGVVAVLYSARSIVRNADWHDSETFWSKTVQQNPGSAIAWAYLGDFQRDRGDTVHAEESYREAIALRDEAGFFYPEAHNKIAQLLEAQGKKNEAIAQYELVLEKRPKEFVALTDLGALLLGDPKKYDEALNLFTRAENLAPDDFRPHANLAQTYRNKGDNDQALAEIDAAIKLNPNQWNFWFFKGEVLALQGHSDEARAAHAQGERLKAGGAAR